MKIYKKIDIYYQGKYICSTMQAANLKVAKQRFLETYKTNLTQNLEEFFNSGNISRASRLNADFKSPKIQLHAEYSDKHTRNL